MNKNFSSSRYQCQHLKLKLRRQQEFLNNFTENHISYLWSKPLEDSFQINGRLWRWPLVQATLQSSDGASSSTLQIKLPRRINAPNFQQKRRVNALFSLQNENYPFKYLKGPSVVEPLFIDLTDLSDEDNCQVLDISSSSSDDEVVPLESSPLKERILDQDASEIFQPGIPHLELSRSTENYAADVTNMAHVPSCSAVNGPSSTVFTTTNINYFKFLPAFQPKVVLKRLLIGGSKTAKGSTSFIVRNLPTSKNPLILKASPTSLKKLPILKCYFLRKTPVLKASSISIASPTLKEPPILNELSVFKEPPISEVPITSIEKGESISVENFTTKSKINEGAFISEELDEFLKHHAQLKNTELQKLDKNIIPIPANDPIFSLGKLKVKE